ncbi:DNA replication licensing factor MCM3 homolog 2-like [Humulus lupulus]|uniref:DNA replication licensing factor MCM3 homolog 2-like n=1 Tax=Humulus lupulus TaxID=3486 RepID=UPI002B40A8D9|nr:DNA replication licensing factor MCM3 homolog 2-like [Humulus lupulus]
MEEREHEKEKETESKRRADRRSDDHDTPDSGAAGKGGPTIDAMDVDDPPTQSAGELSPERIEAFNSLFGQHMRANHLDTLSIDGIEEAVNSRADVRYTRAEINVLLEKLQDANRVMIAADGMVHMIS